MQIEQAIANNMFALKLVVLPLDLLALIRFSSLGAAGPSSRARGGGIGTLKPHSARFSWLALVVVDFYNDSLPGVHTTAVWIKKEKTIPARTLRSVLFVGRTWRNTGLIVEIVPNNRLE